MGPTFPLLEQGLVFNDICLLTGVMWIQLTSFRFGFSYFQNECISLFLTFGASCFSRYLKWNLFSLTQLLQTNAIQKAQEERKVWWLCENKWIAAQSPRKHIASGIPTLQFPSSMVIGCRGKIGGGIGETNWIFSWESLLKILTCDLWSHLDMSSVCGDALGNDTDCYWEPETLNQLLSY